VPDILVLCYHAVSDTWADELAVRPADLERQVQYLLRVGYAPTTFSDAITAPPSRRTLAVTFDDGYLSVFELGFPILASLGVPATLFVPTDKVGTGKPMSWPGIDQWLKTSHRDELIGASWEQIGKLDEAGWEIGSHTRTHPHLTVIDDLALADELSESRQELERRLGRRCRSIAYPYGDVNRRVAEAADRAGYETAGTLPHDRFPTRPRRLLWPRLMVMRSESSTAFARHVSVPVRRLRASPVWAVVTTALPRVRAARAHVTLRRRTGRPSPVLGMCAEGGHLVKNRALVLALGALARLGVGRGLMMWPNEEWPLRIVAAGHTEGAQWLQQTFEPHARRVAKIDPAGWNVIRARAMLYGARERLPAAEAIERALGRAPESPRIAIYSPHGDPLSKATCFLFERDATEPCLVIKAIPDHRQAPRLRHEVNVVERLRDEIEAEEVAAALPLPPLATEEREGDFRVVQAVDPMARFTGLPSEDEAWRWLRGFHAATEEAVTPWGEDDRERALADVEFAWSQAQPERLDRVREGVDSLLAGVEGVEVPVCATHGDFWRGNVSIEGSRLRVYDWEWAEYGQRPFRDIWAHELGELREMSAEASEDALWRGCEASIGRVEAQLALRGIDPRFARATLAPILAWFSFRFRLVTEQAGGNEAGAGRVMTIVDQLLFGRQG
jgi:peptidoglycan/xylan/chitin deacetylase (PgdA/CDA1 family)